MTGEQDSDPDGPLVAAARSGSSQAFEQLVRRHSPRVYAQAICIVRNEADAADVAQEALVKAYQNLASFRGESSFIAWLRRITTNLALMRLRSRHRRRETSTEELLPSFQEDGHHAQSIGGFRETTDLDEQLARRDVTRQAIALLPDNYREILVLRRAQELSTEEAAEFLGISATAVKLRLHRAHQALRTVLAERFETPP